MKTKKKPEGDVDQRVEFASDVPFVRTVLDTDEKAEAATTEYGAKLPGTTPKAVKGDAIIKGYANTWVMDRDFEYISKQAFDGTLSKYLEKNPIILLQHNHDWALGQMLDAGTDLTGLAAEGYIRAPQDRDPDWKHGAYNDVLAGILRTLSIGGFFYREIVDGEILVKEIDLFEISVVAVPSNPDSIFEAAQKAIGGMAPKGNPQGRAKTLDLMGQLLGLRAPTAPEIVGKPELARRAMYHELAASATRDLAVPVPEYHDWRNVAVALDREGADAKTIGTEVEGFTSLYGDLFGLTSKGAGVSLAGSQRPLEGAKAGRALSKANQTKLEKAVENLQAVLASVQQAAAEEEDGGDDTGKSAGGDVKGTFGNVMAEYAIQEALYDGFWALRQAIHEVIEIDEGGEIDTAALSSTIDEFKTWLVKLVRTAVADAGVLAGVESDLKALSAMMGTRHPVAPTSPEQPVIATVVI